MNPASYPGPRTLVVRCPDWSLTVLGVAPGDPALVLAAGRVAAASEAARAVGVARGQRRREAQGRCPEVAVLERDEAERGSRAAQHGPREGRPAQQPRQVEQVTDSKRYCVPCPSNQTTPVSVSSISSATAVAA